MLVYLPFCDGIYGLGLKRECTHCTLTMYLKDAVSMAAPAVVDMAVVLLLVLVLALALEVEDDVPARLKGSKMLKLDAVETAIQSLTCHIS
jgi:hypothetical protein